MSKPIYVIGSNLSHDGSVCLLKDGKICAAIEKERITRKKHDGIDDEQCIMYCLEKENITFNDLDLIVQNSPTSDYSASRLTQRDTSVPVVTISHHLAHAYSAFGTSGFQECAVLVIDGSGNSLKDCIDVQKEGVILNKDIPMDLFDSYRESNSYYHFSRNKCTPVRKEFSRLCVQDMKVISPFTDNSIGDFFGAVSSYCFKDIFDAGKLMGLAPYGDPTVFREESFRIKDGGIWVDHSVLQKFNEPSKSFRDLKDRFQYFADVANWAQRELERAVLYIINSRYEIFPSENLAYAGGVALNAVINSKILDCSAFKRIYIQPAAGDNGVALGCAFYGWLEVLKREKVSHNSTTCFGKIYSTETVRNSIIQFHQQNPVEIKKEIDSFFHELEKEHCEKGVAADDLLLQFNVKNAGVYQVRVNGEGIRSKNDILGRPTSEVSIMNTDLYRGLLDPPYFIDLFNMNKIDITDEEELIHFMNLIRFKPESGCAIGRKAPLYLKYLHYEGDGYIQETARLLSEGKIIGWFQDESEFGPRALGRRSILADPRKTGVRDFINAEIKRREDFRPFAPSVLREDVGLYFQNDVEAPHMITINTIKKEWKDIIGEVVHVDGTCRVQTVTQDWNPKYACLLKEFKKISGISILLNTSFNGKGMPIVEKPEDALHFFYNCKLDYLVIQDIIIANEGNICNADFGKIYFSNCY